ncbi:hypothetical protein E0H46_38645 [Rhizobium leguminosarum bv. viciae]|nr:hypothetical protein E0H46_38645 [Rhizobium leguminosarum bv. viciae]
MTRHGISWDDMEYLEVGDDGRLYWKGEAVIVEKRVKLERYQIWLAVLATIGTLLSGIYPFLDHWHLLG